MVNEVVERSWMGYVLKRIRISMDDKVWLASLDQGDVFVLNGFSFGSQSNGQSSEQG